MTNKRPVVALVFGGQSSEHEISCLTARGVASAIDTDRFDVVGIGISKSGLWHRYQLDEIAALDSKVVEGVTQLPSLDESRPLTVLVRTQEGARLATLEGRELVDVSAVDVVLSLLHGAYGEDGTVQGQFEMMGLPYVGCGVAASAIGMDKHFMKLAFQAADLPVGPFVTIRNADWNADPQKWCQKVIDELEFPVYVKPARGGSSIGISRVAEPAELYDAIMEAREYDAKVVVEQGINDAREIECAVLGARTPGEPPRVTRCGEIVVHTEERFYDFETKYLPEGHVELKVPVELTPDLEEEVREIGGRAFTAIDGEGLARVDVFVREDAEPGHRVIVNEINTMPGFTSISMFPSLWQATGMTYPELISDLIEQALARPLDVNR